MPVRITSSRMQARSGAVRPAIKPVQVSRARCVRQVACEAKKSVGDLTKADLEVRTHCCATPGSIPVRTLDQCAPRRALSCIVHSVARYHAPLQDAPLAASVQRF
jgi:hypothetical protein